MSSLFKNETGKSEIFKLYDAKLKALDITTNSITIKTQFGNTHCLVAGDESKPPILVIHGSNGCAPVALETYIGLKDSFCIYAIDVLAQPNKSAETRLSMKDDSYGIWMNEIITHLQLENVTLAGFSFGGLVILKTLIHNESKIKDVFLSAPAYIVNGNPLKALFKFFIPMKRFMKSKQPKFLEQFLSVAFTEKDDFAFNYLSAVFQYFEMDFTPVPVISAKEAAMIQTPITIIAANEDIIFPGRKMIKRAKKIFPSLQHTLLLPHSKHVQNTSDNKLIANLILDTYL